MEKIFRKGTTKDGLSILDRRDAETFIETQCGDCQARLFCHPRMEFQYYWDEEEASQKYNLVVVANEIEGADCRIF